LLVGWGLNRTGVNKQLLQISKLGAPPYPTILGRAAGRTHRVKGREGKKVNGE
jgi:hypothetical protein